MLTREDCLCEFLRCGHATDQFEYEKRMPPNTFFDSPSEFRNALARVLERPVSDIRQSSGLNASWLDTPLGGMIAVADRHALYLLEFFDRTGLPNELRRLQARSGVIGIGRYETTDQIDDELKEYFSGPSDGFKTPIRQHGSAFTQDVWKILQAIPLGETRSYAEIARTLGRPTASRAVARANGANQISIVVPCHRVIGSDGSLTGYGGGLPRKQWLIDHERKLAHQSVG